MDPLLLLQRIWVQVPVICNSSSRAIQCPLLAFVGPRHAHNTLNIHAGEILIQAHKIKVIFLKRK